MSISGIDSERDAFRELAIALKTNSARILDLIDQSLDKTAGKGGVKEILSTLKATPDDGLRTLILALRTIEESTMNINRIMGRYDDPKESPV